MRRLLPVLMLLLLAVLAPAAAMSVHLPDRPDKLTVTRPRGIYPRKLRVPFSHQKHAALTCQSCHHTLEALGSVEKCSTSGCHDMVAPHCPREMRSGRYYKNAFHRGAASCLGCHKERSAERHKSGPVGCGGCHSQRGA